MPSYKGFGTIDILFALGIMGLMIGAYARQETENYSHRRADSIANSVSSVMDATKFYIGNNYNALLSHLDVGQSMEIPLINNPDFLGIGDLATNSALLPSGFTGKIAKGQTLHLILKHIGQTAGRPDYISGMVMTTGGANLTDREVGLAVNAMGLSGGGVMSKPPIGHTSGSIYGGYGTWSYPVTQWQVSGVTPAVGHIAMVTDSFSLPTGDYLSRYNGSNPESIRMHTDLDMGNGEDGMSGNQINGVHAIFGANNQDTRLQDTYHSGRVNFGNGGIACANDSMGCHFDIGTKGGFYDNEDGWITFQNNSPTLGLKSSNTTDVLGATMDNDILTRDGVSYSFSASGAPGQDQDAALTYNGQWINATGGSGFQGISSNLMQAQRFQDRTDNSYYFIPSQLSRLYDVQLVGQLATDGLDFKGGLHTEDVYASNDLNVANTRGHAIIALTANGNGYIGGNTTIAGNVQAKGTISTDGLDASNPQAWDSLSNSGGIHVSALKSDGGSIFVGSNYSGYAGSGLLNQSKAEVSGIAKASVFRTRGPKPVSGESCTGNITAHNPYSDVYIGNIINEQIKDNTPLTYQNGDIAADASGAPLSCVNGVWHRFSDTLFSSFNGCNTISQWTNTSGQPEFVSAYSNTENNDTDVLSMTLISPSGQTYLVSSTGDPSDGGVKRYTVDGFVPNGWSAHIDSTIGVAGVCHWGGNVPGANNPTSLPDVPNAPDPTPVTPPAPVTPTVPVQNPTGPLTVKDVCNPSSFPKINISNPLAKILTISSTVYNYNVHDHLMSDAGWDGITPVDVMIIVEPCIIVGSTDTSSYALTIPQNFPTGTTLNLINDGYIVGAGGRGGDGNWSNVLSGPNNGENGGPALSIAYNMHITNNGIISGGGGGGGGNGLIGRSVHEYGGGGGAGSIPGNGGVGYFRYWHGHAGSLLIGGHSGAWEQLYGGTQSCNNDNDLGYEGGDIGQPGRGNPCYAIGQMGYGGLAGDAIDGTSFVLWDAQGTIVGPSK